MTPFPPSVVRHRDDHFSLQKKDDCLPPNPKPESVSGVLYSCRDDGKLGFNLP